MKNFIKVLTIIFTGTAAWASDKDQLPTENAQRKVTLNKSAAEPIISSRHTTKKTANADRKARWLKSQRAFHPYQKKNSNSAAKKPWEFMADQQHLLPPYEQSHLSQATPVSPQNIRHTPPYVATSYQQPSYPIIPRPFLPSQPPFFLAPQYPQNFARPIFPPPFQHPLQYPPQPFYSQMHQIPAPPTHTASAMPGTQFFVSIPWQIPRK